MAGSSRDPEMNHLQIEFYARCRQVILESRIPGFMSTSPDGSASTPSGNIRVPAFNLVLGKSGAFMDSMEPWCKSIDDPMVIDILCSKQGNDRAVEGVVQNVGKGAGNLLEKPLAGLAFANSGLEQLILLERWTIESRPYGSQSLGKVKRESGYQGHKEVFGTQNYIWGVEYFCRGGNSGKNESVDTYNVVEKNMAILLRSTYSTARLLPAQNLFKLLSTSGHSKFKMLYKATASPLSSNSKGMTHFHFTPIETHHGHLQVSVAYRQKIPSIEKKRYAICPQIIQNYVGSAASLRPKELLANKAGQAHSVPSSAQRLSAFKFDNLQRHGVANKGAGPSNLNRVHTVSVDGGNPSSVENFECPFDIREEQPDKMTNKAKLRSVKSDAGGFGKAVTHVPGGPLEAFQAFKRPATLMSRAHQPNKEAANALKELKVYIDLKDRLLK